MTTLLSGATATVTGDSNPCTGGVITMIVSGTFTGSVVLQIQSPDGTWVPMAGTTVTVASAINVTLPSTNVRAVLTGGTGSVNVYI